MIQVRDATFSYGASTPALRAVQLEVRPGERVAVVGANGSGKTTLARCLNGLVVPQQGEVRVDGFCTASAGDLFEVRRRVGMVFQNPDDQLVSTTVETEIAFGLENLAVPRPEMQHRVDEVLSAFHLEGYRRHPPHRLSGGEKQRVAIAAAVAMRPVFLVLDEPTSLLDPQSRGQVGELLRSLGDEYGIATILITQVPEEAARCERVLVMDHGALVLDAAPEVVFADPERLEALGLAVPFSCALLRALRRADLRLDGCLPPCPDLDCLARTVSRAWVRPPAPPGAPPAPAPHEPSGGVANGHAKVEAEGVEHVYDRGLPTRQVALRGADLRVPPGAIVALIGPSGSGKTTLAQHLNGLLRPDRGRILLEGQDIWGLDLPRLRQRVGLVFQFPELQLFEETVARDVAFGPRNLGYPPARVDELVEAALEEVGLPPAQFAGRSPLALSGGERRRVALAGVLAMDPEVLVLDEPTAGLDPRAALSLQQVLARLRRQGRTLVLVTHDMDLVAGLATHVAVLVEGRVRMWGATRQVLLEEGFTKLSGLELPAATRFMRALVGCGLPLAADRLTLGEVVGALLGGNVHG
ncbi:MAG: energy-coupling factor transporter ATPase [Candidatus Latescibacterota bacterium]